MSRPLPQPVSIPIDADDFIRLFRRVVKKSAVPHQHRLYLRRCDEGDERHNSSVLATAPDRHGERQYWEVRMMDSNRLPGRRLEADWTALLECEGLDDMAGVLAGMVAEWSRDQDRRLLCS